MSTSSRPRRAVMGALLAMFATSPGQTFCLSGFNGSLGRSLELDSTQLAGAYLIGTLLSAACLTHAGRVADRIGPRHMIAAASIGLALSSIGLSMVQGLVGLTLAFFGLRFFGQGTLTLASSHALALRFEKNLGAVEGLRGATVSAAIATTPQIAVLAIAALGWRSAAWVIGVGAALMGLFAAYGLLDQDPKRAAKQASPTSGATGESEPAAIPGRDLSLPEARRTASFWTLLGCTAYTATVLTAVHFHLQAILRGGSPEGPGLSEAAAAGTFASFAGFGLVATLVGGPLVDRLHPSRLLAAAMALIGTGAALMTIATSMPLAHAAMGVMGLGHGLGGAVSAPTLARFFGRAHHGAIRGASGTAAVAGSAAGPYLLSAAAGPLGGFGASLWLCAALAIPLVFAAICLRRPA